MQISDMPQYRAHLSRHGHNLNHKFDFTSSTGHLLTLFSQIMNPKEKIKGHIDMFSRTQPLNSPSHVEINTYIDYFFVPLDMLYSGFGDSLYQTNEPYSTTIKVSNNSLPVVHFASFIQDTWDELLHQTSSSGDYWCNFNLLDKYNGDSLFMSLYRNLFHNYCNPNGLFNQNSIFSNVVHPLDNYQPNVLPLSLMAYNCVYQNFYRLDEREKFNNALYNIDADVYNSDPLFDFYRFEFMSLKYRPLAFDYFTSAKVAPLINPLNINGQNNNTSLLAINNYLSSVGIGTMDSSMNDSLNIQNRTASTYPDDNTTLNAVNTQTLRSLFAVEKILSVTGRAKKSYDAQVLAHLGVDVPRDIKHEITYVGTQRGSIKVGEIIATAGTADTPFGDMAGKGYGNVGIKSIDFTAPCHGVFIAIYSAVPRLSYYAPLEKHMQISSRLDFFHPEFEKLGMQPIFGYECTPYNTSFAGSIAGWQMRYQQYKQRYDKVSPAFIDHYTQNYISPDFGSSQFNQWKNWVIATRPYRSFMSGPADPYVSMLKNFLSLPTDLNDIMAVHYGWTDNTISSISPTTVAPEYWRFESTSVAYADRKSFANNPATLFYRDPLIHFANINFKLVSEMSDNTLPDLNF